MIYFDHASTTRPSKEALEAFNKASLDNFGNASALHEIGFKANKALEEARKGVLDLLGVYKTHECIFLSGASEANNMALKGIAFKYKNRGNVIISSEGEHPSVKVALEQLSSSFGFEVIYLPLDENGHVSVSSLQKAMSKQVILVSIMAINNETGAVSPIKEYVKILKDYPKALLHVDATQGIGKIDLPYANIDLLSFSSHKIEGLKGSGALIYNRKLSFLPLISGGEQERGFRSGTPALPLDIATFVALKEALAKKEENLAKVRPIYEFLKENLAKTPGISVNSPEDGSPYVLNISTLEHRASVIIEALSEKGVYVSSVSSCSSKLDASSYVLRSMGMDERRCQNSIRLSFGGDNSLEEAKEFLLLFQALLQEIRKQ